MYCQLPTDTTLLLLFLCQDLFIYLKVWAAEGRRERSICWFSPQMAASASDGPGWSQKPRGSSSSPMWVVGAQTHIPPAAFLAVLAVSRIRNATDRTWTVAHRGCWQWGWQLNQLHHTLVVRNTLSWHNQGEHENQSHPSLGTHHYREQKTAYSKLICLPFTVSGPPVSLISLPPVWSETWVYWSKADRGGHENILQRRNTLSVQRFLR